VQIRYKESWCLVHFSTHSQILGKSHTVTQFVLAGKRHAIYQQQYLVQYMVIFQWGTQQEHSATKHAII